MRSANYTCDQCTSDGHVHVADALSKPHVCLFVSLRGDVRLRTRKQGVCLKGKNDMWHEWMHDETWFEVVMRLTRSGGNLRHKAKQSTKRCHGWRIKLTILFKTPRVYRVVTTGITSLNTEQLWYTKQVPHRTPPTPNPTPTRPTFIPPTTTSTCPYMQFLTFFIPFPFIYLSILLHFEKKTDSGWRF